ncbi:hypothetical protein [Streptomyces sp. NPDC056194]|uniref:hypothetical protein n=1 Tax=Streptomyces sp. NPDC056194 TaxID=3345744 RepID=UPI0035D9FA75
MTTLSEVTVAYEQLRTARTEAAVRTIGAQTEADLADQRDQEHYRAVKKLIGDRTRAASRVREARRRLKHAKSAEETQQRVAELHAAQAAETAARTAYEEAKGTKPSAKEGWASLGRLIRAGFWPVMGVLAALAVYAVAALSWKPAADPDSWDDDQVLDHHFRRGLVGFLSIIGLTFLALFLTLLATEGGLAVVIAVPILAITAGLAEWAWLRACDRHEAAIFSVD